MYTDKVVIITGGSKGIGKGCVEAFVAAGAKVVFCARNSDEGESLAKELNSNGPGEATFIACDVAKTFEVRNLIDATIAEYDRLDGFPRNALAIHPFVAMWAAYGLVTLHGWIVRRPRAGGGHRAGILIPALTAVILLIAAVPVWHLADHLRVRTDSRNLAREWVGEQLPPNSAVVIPTELGFDSRGLGARGRHVKVVDLLWARNRAGVDALLDDVPSPAVLMVPRWGADRRSPGQKTADALNAASQGRRVIKSFGSNDVLVNYSSTTAWGDPAFAIAIVK